MAPVQINTSFSTLNNSSFDITPTICRCGGLSEGCMEWWLPISRRGHFFQDSFFENFRSHYDAALRNILKDWGDNDILNGTWNSPATSLVDTLTRYRQLRTLKKPQENQDITIVSDNNNHKIVMDIHDFMDGDVKVKVLGEKEVLIEGQRNTNMGMGSGLQSSQTFSRRFILPDSVNMAAITSVVSSDGILTIEAPKLTTDEKVAESETQEKLNKSVMENNCRVSNSTSNTMSKDNITASASFNSFGNQDASNKVFYCKCCNKKIGSWQKDSQSALSHQEGFKVPIKIQSSLAKKDQDFSNTQGAHLNFKDKNQTKDIKIERTNESLMNKELHKKEVTTNKATSEQNKSVTESNEELNASSSITKNAYDVPIATGFQSLPILRRGLFFSDSIFKDLRKDFQSAVQEVLSKWGERSSLMSDDLTTYRNLRIRDLKEETQAVKSIEDDSSHKFVLDVQDFMNGGEVTVKALSDRELVIEGKIEKEEGGSKSLKRFLKRFHLPGNMKLESVSSVVSSDGILTITAPKKSPSIEIREIEIPVTKEETGTKNENDVKKQMKHQKDSSVSSESNSQEVTSDLRKNSKEHIIPINVEGKSCDQKMKTRDSQTESQKKSSEESFEKIQSKGESLQENNYSEGCKVKEIVPVKVTGKNNDSFIRQTEKCQSAQKEMMSVNKKKEDVKMNENGSTISSASNSRYLPISRQGLFFNDSFFQDYQKDFQTAVTDVLMKSRERVNTADNMDVYRSLRQRDLKVENQALHAHEDHESFKVVLDAKDFINGDVTVSVDGEELVIEGRAENNGTTSSNSLTFSHRFLLPESADLSAIRSAISSDGILIVNSPKKGNSSATGAVRKTSSEVRSKRESHNDGGHQWEEKTVKESHQQSKGFSSNTFSSSQSSYQQHSAMF